MLDQFGVTEFVGYTDDVSESRVVAVIPTVDENGEEAVELFLDRTPFYAEAGGQIGDTGTITGLAGSAEVLDTTFALPNLRRHLAKVTSGSFEVGAKVTATIDVERRSAIRRNHTGTHVLHWALRHVLGDHVKQAGSHVGPDRLRFDFSHYAAVSDEEIAEIERLANIETLENSPVRAFETTKDEAESLGAIAFLATSTATSCEFLKLESRPNFAEALTSERPATSAPSKLSASHPSGRTCAVLRPSPGRQVLHCCSVTRRRSPPSLDSLAQRRVTWLRGATPP